jgi:thiamine-phosphate pyrophosphorylase
LELNRTIDANINRLREGLRVIEDLLRYQFNAAGVIPIVKQLRHSIADVDKKTFRSRISFRDALNDDGYDNIGSNENVRADAQDLLRANFLRCQEASRVLEELLKTRQYEEELYLEVKSIRYSLYELEKTVFLQFGNITQRDVFLNLCLVTDQNMAKKPLTEIIEKAINGGVTSVQLREKSLSDRELIQAGMEIKKVCENYNIPLIVNDRVDICQALKAQGVHLGQDDMPVTTARNILGSDAVIGLSTNTIEQVKEAQNLPVDYIGFGSLFKTVTKKDVDITGLGIINKVLEISKLPVLFIGGINTSNVESVKKAGAFNIAVCNDFMISDNPEKTAKILKK